VWRTVRQTVRRSDRIFDG